jgi:hypothetical protein
MHVDSLKVGAITMRRHTSFSNILRTVVCWAVTPCGLVGGYKRFDPEDRGDALLRNAGNHLQYYSPIYLSV